MMPLFSPVLFIGLRVDQGIAAMVQTIGIMDVVRSDSRRPLTISAIELGRLWDVLEQDGGAKMLSPVRRGPWFKKDDPVRLKDRSEEHTSELQSLMRITYAVFCLTKKNR